MPTSDTYARFYIHPSLISGKAKTDTAIYDDKLYAEIFIKGSTNTSFSRPKTDQDEIDFKEEWSAYSNNEDYKSSGTSLRTLPNIGPSAEMNLNAKGVMSVEDLASLADGVVFGESGMVDLRKQAQAYMAVIEPEKADAEKQALTDQLADMQAKIDALTPKTRRKRNKDTGQLE